MFIYELIIFKPNILNMNFNDKYNTIPTNVA